MIHVTESAERVPWRLGHRPSLDGLRGGAIALVVIAHTGAPGLSAAGGVGVTMFFVLSGFLITGLLLQEQHATGHVDLRAFYVRRARRIVPALVALILVVIAVSLVFGPWWFEWQDLPPTLFFYGNWVEAFSPTAGTTLGALSITWSLAIEEPFYLLWPLLVIAMGARRRVVVLAAGLAAASLLARFLSADDRAARIYYGSDTAAFALLIGAAAVGLRLGGGPGRSRPWLAAIGALVIAWVVFWPGEIAVLLGIPAAALTTVVVIWACTGVGASPILGNRVLRWLGSRSYSLYLWHGPLLDAMREHFHLPWPIIALVGVPISLGLAELSWRFIETPFRARRAATTDLTPSDRDTP